MLRWAFALLVCFPAWTADYTCSQSVNGAGFTLNCQPIGAPPPPPPPAPPPQNQLAPPNTSAFDSGSANVVHTYALPKSNSGFLQIGQWTQTPTEMQFEVSISPTPGDTNYYKTAPQTSPRGGTYYPCGVVGGASQGLQIAWSSGGSFSQCRVPANEQWYINFKYGASCGASCNVSYYHSEQ